MRHSYILEGFGFRLRPVEDADAALILQLRNDPERGRYLHRGASTLEEQLAWLAAYYNRPGDYCFAIDRRRTGETEGFISLYGIDEDRNSAEWGRWILKPTSLAAVESVYLMFSFAFDCLALSFVYSRTVAENRQVVAFHDALGLHRRILPNWFELHGERKDAVEHTLDATHWRTLAPSLKKQVARLAHKLG
ncbi:MAG: GNAT family N-acetyltransferase [Hydrogenophilus sp.]|nr:GNAT family N-acetyltransferase [Hydrogenophilus sp.]